MKLEEYALGFGEMSKFDEKTLKIFKEFSARLAKEEFNGEEPRSFFDMIHDYMEIVEGLDQPFIWKKVISSKSNNAEKAQEMKRWTTLVFGEMGHGKSTTLNEIAKIFSQKYLNDRDHDQIFKS